VDWRGRPRFRRVCAILFGVAVNTQRIAVLGLGYVGCVSAACLADLGHTVMGVDRDGNKVNGVQRGQAPFYEPGLQDLVARNVSAGRLAATTSLAEALAGSDIALVCVGTPSDAHGNLGLDQLTRVCSDIRSLLATRTTPLVVAVRSTVFPGTCEGVAMEALAHPRTSVWWPTPNSSVKALRCVTSRSRL